MSRRLVLRIMVVLSVFIIVSCSDGASQTDPGTKANKPPVTTISPDQKFISHQRDIELKCTDSNVNDSCVNTYFSWEGQAPTVAKGFEYNGAFKVGEAQQYNDDDIISVSYFSVDTNNAEETIKIKEYILDKTAPVAVADLPAGTSNSALDLTFTCSDKKAANPSQDGSGCRDFYYYTTADVSDTPDSSPGNTDFSVVALKNSGVIDLVIPLNSSTYVHYFAVDAAGSRQVVKKAYYEFVPLVSDVVNFKALAGNGQVALSWEVPAGSPILGVQIMRSQVKAPNLPSEGILVYKGPISPKIDPGLVIGQTYYYTAFAYDGSGNFSLGVANSATPFSDPPPAEVAGLVSIAGNTQVIFNWTNPTDTDFAFTMIRRSANKAILSILDGVEVYKSTGLPGTNETATDPGLVNNKLYYYGVFTVDINQNVSAGSYLSVTPVDLPPDNIPTFTAKAGDNFVDLSWSYPTDPDLAGVKIVRKVDSAPTAHNDKDAVLIANVKDLAITILKDTTVTNNTIYYYAAYAFDKKPTTPNYSLKGNIEGPVTPVDITPPAEVTGLTTTPADGKIALAWINPPDADFANVLILRKTGGYATSPADTSAQKVSPGTVQPLIDDNAGAGLLNGTLYYYTIYTADEVPNYSAGMQIQGTPGIDTTGPTVSTTTPIEAATAVDPTIAIGVEFSEDILRTSVVDRVMTLTAQTGVDSLGVPITRTLVGVTPTMPSTTSIQMTLENGQLPLANKITASLKVATAGTPGVTDLSDNPLDPTPQTGSYDWSFTTADGSWDTAISVLSNKDPDYEHKSAVAMDGNGNGIAVWRDFDAADNIDVIVAQKYSALSGWDSVKTPISTSKVYLRSGLTIAMDSSGNAVVVWFGDIATTGVVVADRYINGSWSGNVYLQTNISSAADTLIAPSVVIDANGIVTVVWSQKDNVVPPGKIYNIWAKRFDIATPDWQNLPAAELIEWNNDGRANLPQVTSDKAGNIMAIWVHRDATGTANVLYNRFDISSDSWDQPTTMPVTHPHSIISDGLDDVSRSSIGSDDAGNAISVWTQTVPKAVGGTIGRVITSRYDVTTNTWGNPTPISSNTLSSVMGYPSIAVHTDGSAIATWSIVADVYANRFEVANDWMGDLKIGATLSSGATTLVTFDTFGNGQVIIDEANTISAFRYIYGTPWDQATLLIAGTDVIEPLVGSGNANDASVAVDNNGNAIVLWNKKYTPTALTLGHYLRASVFNYKPAP